MMMRKLGFHKNNKSIHISPGFWKRKAEIIQGERIAHYVDYEPPDEIALLYAAQKGNHLLVKELIAAGVDVNFQSVMVGYDDLQTALTIAIGDGHETIVRDLIDAKADVNKSNSWGKTPLMGAALSGHEAMVHLLIAAKADINIIAEDGDSALRFAIYKKNEACASVLIDAKADLEFKNYGRDFSAVEDAIFFNVPGVVNKLLAHSTLISNPTRIYNRIVLLNRINAFDTNEAFFYLDVLYQQESDKRSGLVAIDYSIRSLSTEDYQALKNHRVQLIELQEMHRKKVDKGIDAATEWSIPQELVTLMVSYDAPLERLGFFKGVDYLQEQLNQATPSFAQTAPCVIL